MAKTVPTIQKKEHRNGVPFSSGQAKKELSDLVKLKNTESTGIVKEGMNVVELNLFKSHNTIKIGGRGGVALWNIGESE